MLNEQESEPLIWLDAQGPLRSFHLRMEGPGAYPVRLYRGGVCIGQRKFETARERGYFMDALIRGIRHAEAEADVFEEACRVIELAADEVSPLRGELLHSVLGSLRRIAQVLVSAERWASEMELVTH